MKKNKMMRVASALLVAVLMTTSVISGTFAKYVTTDSATDSARVAKWGVTVLASGTLFGQEYNEYATDDTTYSETATSNQISATASTSVSLEDNGTGNIVAPGTKNTTGMTLSIKGTPEVATKVTVSSTDPEGDATNSFSDIYLAAGTYAVLVEAKGVNADNFKDYYVGTTSDSGESATTTYAKVADNETFSDTAKYYELHDSVTVSAEKYYPVVWTLTKTGEQSGDTYSTVKSMFDAINTAFAASTTINKAIDKEYTITWEWEFEDTSIAHKDGADTSLGNLMADTDTDNYVVV